MNKVEKLQSLYDADPHAWSLEQVAPPRAGRVTFTFAGSDSEDCLADRILGVLSGAGGIEVG